MRITFCKKAAEESLNLFQAARTTQLSSLLFSWELKANVVLHSIITTERRIHLNIWNTATFVSQKEGKENSEGGNTISSK